MFAALKKVVFLPPISSPGGEIGRHATLRGWCRLRHASSTLVLGTHHQAPMAELVDAYVSGAYIERCAGSTPVRGTNDFSNLLISRGWNFCFIWFFFLLIDEMRFLMWKLEKRLEKEG